MGFSRQEYRSGLPCSPPGIEPVSLMSPAVTGGFFNCSCHLGSPSDLLFMKWKHMSMDLSENIHSNFVENSLKMLSRFSCVWLFGTPWTVAHQALLSMGFSRQEYWSGLPFPSPGDLLDTGMEPMSLMSPALAGGFFTTCATWEKIEITQMSISGWMGKMWHVIYGILFNKKREKLLVESQKRYAKRQKLVKKKKKNLYEFF